MLQFILGVLVGGFIGFAIFAVCAMAGTRSGTNEQCAEKTEENNARRK